MKLKEITQISEDWSQIKITPTFVRRVMTTARKISLEIADELPKGQNLIERITELLKEIDRVSTIGQTITVERAELRRLEDIPDNILDVGAHWAWKDGGAIVYHHENGEERHGTKNLKTVILFADVPFGSVDWVYTVATNLIHPSEGEITVKNDSTIMLNEIFWNNGQKYKSARKKVYVYGDYDVF